MVASANERASILIIDDNMTNLKVIMDYLQAYSFEILIARNGADGLESAQIARPDLILLDVQMPGIDGFEVCRRLKANPDTRHIPVIFMTALTEVRDKVHGLEAGAVDYVTKPIESRELLARVNTQLQLKLLQDQLASMNEALEDTVRERTAALEAEIALRQVREAEKEQLLQTMTQQSEHLRHVTQMFLQNQQNQQQGVAQALKEYIQDQLSLLNSKLGLAEDVLPSSQSMGELSLAQSYIEQAQTIVNHLKERTESLSISIDQAVNEQRTLMQNPLMSLSVREREVLRYLAAGKSRKEIAEILVISPGTVSTYRTRIMQKLEVEDYAGLMKVALEYHLT